MTNPFPRGTREYDNHEFRFGINNPDNQISDGLGNYRKAGGIGGGAGVAVLLGLVAFAIFSPSSNKNPSRPAPDSSAIIDNKWYTNVDVPGGKILVMAAPNFDFRNQVCLSATQVTAQHTSDGWGVIRDSNRNWYIRNGTIQRDWNSRPYINGPSC